MGHVGDLIWQDDRGATAFGESELQRRISVAVWRALAEPAFAQMLLSDPGVVLGSFGCTPQQRLLLERLRAPTIKDFARQAEATFWALPGHVRSTVEPVARAAGE